MLKLLQELINEHGSSTILKERLELIGDRYNALEEELTDCQEKHRELRTKFREAQVRIKELEVARAAEAAPDHSDLDEDGQKVLRVLFEKDDLSVGSISAKAGVDPPMTEYYRGILEEKGFIRMGSVTAGAPGYPSYVGWQITTEGRKFVVSVIGRSGD